MEITNKELTRIEDLTRRYATYSRSQAGLSAAWGGLCVALLGGLVLGSDLHSYSNHLARGGSPGFWRFLQKMDWAQQPLLTSIALALPALWLLGRAWIQRRVYERHGLVIEARTQLCTDVHLVQSIVEIAVAVTLILGVWIDLAFWSFPAQRIPGALLSNAVALMLPLLGRRMVSSSDRNALLILCLGSANVLQGGYAEAVLGLMLASTAMGVVLIVMGIWAHAQFRKVKHELDALPADMIGPPAGTNAAPAESRSFAPRILPRDAGDFAVALSISVLQIGSLFVLPSLVAGFLAHSPAVGEYTFFFLLVVFLSFTVEKITIDRSGVRFHRFFGSPKLLAWKRIVAVEEAPRSELILHGWVWPLFPAREMTACMSSVGHYRITWDDGYCYFPPADARQFEACVAGRVRDGQAAACSPAPTIDPLQQ